MTRHLFGGSLEAFTISAQNAATQYGSGALVARLQPSILVTFWSSEVGGTRYTDLLLNAAPTTSITTDAAGEFPVFSGPDDATDGMWADPSGVAGTGPRRWIRANDLIIKALVTDLLTSSAVGKVLMGELAGANSGLATLDGAGVAAQPPAAHAHAAYKTVVRPDGVSSAQRDLLKFTGGATVTDDSGGGQTVVNVPTQTVNDLVTLADQTLNNSTSRTAITGLSQAVAAGETWIFEGEIVYDSDASADIVVDLTCPAGSLLATWRGPSPAATVTSSSPQQVVTNASGSGASVGGLSPTLCAVRVNARFKCTTSGTVQFRFGQSSLQPLDTIIKAGSWLTAARVI